MKYEVDTKHRVIRVMPEREEDLYFLYLLIDKGDVVRGWTVREYKPEGSKEGERIKMYLAVRVESLEYHKFRGSLRVRGPVVEVQQDVEGVKGRRHTFDVVPGRELEIEKSEDRYLVVVEEILNMAKSVLPRILLVSIDDEEAAVAQITALGFEVLQILQNREKDESLLSQFLQTVQKAVEDAKRRLKPDKVVIASPSILIDEVAHYIQGEKHPQNAGGLAGVYEFIRRGLYDKLKEEMGIAAYEKFIEKLSKNRDSVAIGPVEVWEAATAGRVDSLLVLDTYIKESPEESWKIMAEVYKTRGRIYIIREDTEVGIGLKAMEKIVAILRW
ncbi:MAG: mRNA surveillance protein Pelota [Pyrobaculum sp.]